MELWAGELQNLFKRYEIGLICPAKLCHTNRIAKMGHGHTKANFQKFTKYQPSISMIRIYLDWNVVSNLKRPEFKEFKAFINKHKEYLQFPYSPAHFNDLMKSYTPDNAFFQKDLEMLEFLSEEHLMRWEKHQTVPLFASPKEYFENEKKKIDDFSAIDIEQLFATIEDALKDSELANLGSAMKRLMILQPAGININDDNKTNLNKMFPNLTTDSTLWDLMKDAGIFCKNLLKDGAYYKDLRKSIGNQGFKLESNSGNWKIEEVISKIDDYLLSLGTNMTYFDYVNLTFKHREESVTKYDFFTTAYLMFDMIGYKQDRLPKSGDNMQNIQTDGEHSFYGAYCDYFVVGDKNLRIKSKVLYNKLNIQTVVLSPEELIPTLSKVIHKINLDKYFLEEALDYIGQGQPIEYMPVSEEIVSEHFGIKLPIFYFNFFNYVERIDYPNGAGIVFVFKRIFKNYSRFVYFTETERLIDRLTEYFGYSNKSELAEHKRQFVYENDEIQFRWSFQNGVIILQRDSETYRPELAYVLSTKTKN